MYWFIMIGIAIMKIDFYIISFIFNITIGDVSELKKQKKI